VPRSEVGHKRTWQGEFAMSALPQKADMVQLDCDVRFVPTADICHMVGAASTRLRSQVNKSLRLQLSDTYHAAFVGKDEARQQIFERHIQGPHGIAAGMHLQPRFRQFVSPFRYVTCGVGAPEGF
jgi:hypothetical protein